MYCVNKIIKLIILIFILVGFSNPKLLSKIENYLKVDVESKHILRCIIIIVYQQVHFANHVFLFCFVLIL